MSLWDWLFNPSGLTPHGFCLSWAPGLVALHTISDLTVGLAYFSIPLALMSFAAQRKDLQYRWVAYLFVAFILACGTTHLMSVVTLWVPAYGIEGLIKLVTAILSIATAVLLWPLIPKVVAIPSSAQLEQLNHQLGATVEELTVTAAKLGESEAAVRSANIDLERRVAERTAELTAVNAQLHEALAQRRIAEEALARSERDFRASFEEAAVGKAHSDPNSGRIIRVNRAFAEMLGYDPEEMVGRDVWDFTWPEEFATEEQRAAQVLDGRTDTIIREKRYLRKDGQPIWGRASATLVRDAEDGKPSLTVAVIENIDERYKAQQALLQAKQDLEGLVEERTEALAQRDLLLREVYHRVKNNLQIIDGMLVMQMRKLSDAATKASLQSLRSRVFALGLVHHQLMGSDDLKTFNVAPFLEELSANIVEGGSGEGVKLSVRAIPLDVGLDFAIPLGLLVTELVTNALKHAFPTTEGAIDVVLEKADDGAISLVVSDDGRGYDAARTEPKTRKGSLGMNIIAGLVKQMKGTMVMRNDQGARFEIHVPSPVPS